MAVHKRSRDLSTFLALAVVFAIGVFANLLADRGFYRLDLTQEQRYSLSQPFKNILANLESPLQLTFYSSDKPPAGFERNKQEIYDKLKELATTSNGMIELTVIDPSTDKILAKKLREENPDILIQAQTLEKDKISFTGFYSALRLTYRDKPSVLIPQVRYPGDLEYFMAREIVNMTIKQKPIVAVYLPPSLEKFNPLSQQAPASGYEWIADPGRYGPIYDVRTTDLTEGSPIPGDTKLLILVTPQDLSPRAVYEVVKYLAEGGRVFLIDSPFKHDIRFGKVEKVTSGLEGYLRHLGLEFGQDFLCDTQNVRLFHSVNPITGEPNIIPNPQFIRILPTNINQENPMIRYLPGLTMPYAAELKIIEPTLDQHSLELDRLARTSDETWTVPFKGYNVQSTSLKQPKQFAGSKPVFVQIDGAFPFPFAGHPVPGWSETERQEHYENEGEKRLREKEEAGKKGSPKDAKASAQSAPGRLMVWTSPTAFHSNYVHFSNPMIAQNFAANQSVFRNASEINTLGNDLPNIRAKSYETRSIDTLPGEENDTKRTLIKLALILGVPFLLVFLGLTRWLLRRRDQNTYERQYATTSGPSAFSP